ncbi:MAG: hypothetical protein HY590_03560 [Candidatus Omnitrophica bacterium]|nr:hypothetical protein [Candidatus Omnitrophota bacterium]
MRQHQSSVTLSAQSVSLSHPGLYDYGSVTAWSMGCLFLLLAWAASANLLHFLNIIRMRNFLGYGHFTLAYIFTWRLVCRRYGNLPAAFGYLAAFLTVMGAYAALLRWWLPTQVNFLFVEAVFMTHHASNEVLFRQQTANGYQPAAWTTRGTFWVTLAVGLVLIDQLAMADHMWHRALPVVAALWTVLWIAYGWYYLLPAPRSSRSLFGWSAVGILGGLCLAQPFGEPLFTSAERFALIVIYHYIIWYVFYARKLLSRTGQWRTSQQFAGKRSDLWRFGTTVPIGFLWLVLVGNLVIFAIFRSTAPLAQLAREWGQIDFFMVNTIAHILFGVGLPRPR